MELDIHVQKTNKTYKTNYGIPFQCVELIRRFFSTNPLLNVSFPSVVDAVDFFNSIHTLSSPSKVIKLETFSYPYNQHFSHYLKPGSILFWKRRNPNFPDGHVALILESNDKETIVVQQNHSPPIKKYDTKDLFAKMNYANTKFAGIKTLPAKVSSTIQNVAYHAIRI
jgi:hypothetical protein